MRAHTLSFQLPRHPLLRMLAIAGGAVLLVGLVATGLVVGVAILAVAATSLLVRRWLARRRQERGDPAVIEGEFSVVPRRPRSSLPHPD
jgi:membrane protein implicated in regulation of membrane protease activity